VFHTILCFRVSMASVLSMSKATAFSNAHSMAYVAALVSFLATSVSFLPSAHQATSSTDFDIRSLFDVSEHFWYVDRE